MTEEEKTLNLNDWYNPAEAAKRLSANSGKTIDVSYVRTLAKYGKIGVYKLSARMTLYSKADTDAYIVEKRGQRAARAKRQKALAAKSRE